MISALVVSCMLWAGFQSPQMGDTDEMAFSGFLYQRADGQVRLGELVMFGNLLKVKHEVYEQRLTPELAAKFTPLVNKVKSLENSADGQYQLAHLLWAASPNFQDFPAMAVVMHIKRRLTEIPQPGHYVYTVDSAQLLNAEKFSEEWLNTWWQVESIRHDIDKTKLGHNKDNWTAAIEKAKRGLTQMAAVKTTDAFRETVKAIDANAFTVEGFHRFYRMFWQEAFQKDCAAERFQSSTPWPAPEKKFSVEECLAQAKSAKEFVEKTRAGGGEMCLLVPVLYRGGDGKTRPICVLKTPELPSEVFDRMRQDAVKHLHPEDANQP